MSEADPERQSSPVLTLAFGTTIAMWIVAYLAMLGPGRVLGGNTAAGGEQRNADPGKIEFRQVFHHHRPAAELHGIAGRPGAGQGMQLADREVPLVQNLQHGLTNQAGRPYNCNVILF